MQNKLKKAVILLSGGLDSATVLAIANKKFEICALSFDYGQRHSIELDCAKKIAKKNNIKIHKIIKINPDIFQISALTNKELAIPKDQDVKNQKKIPITYVPARNTIFLSYALAFCEVIKAHDIFIGANAIDYSGYPDCREKYIKSFEDMANEATILNKKIKIHAPLINMNKAQIIKTGIDLGVDYSDSFSCYDPIYKKNNVYVCGRCDSCLLRKDGFLRNNLKDPVAINNNNI
jgi:7-cyano-7-deazaguanine synthase